jgi:hypothetical protein
MALSYWGKSNPNIKLETTKKQYFNRYLWRLVYDLPGASLISDKRVSDIVEYVRERRRQVKDHSYYSLANSYYAMHRERYAGVDEESLARIRLTMNSFKDLVKYRVEHNTMQIYAENEADLIRVSQAIGHDGSIVSISSPQPGTEDALRNGNVIMNKIDYKYKIVLRDGNYSTETKNSVLMQLDQREDVKVPKNLRVMLGKRFPALWGGYFYANDDSIVTVLSLISPGIVGKIHPIDHLQ